MGLFFIFGLFIIIDIAIVLEIVRIVDVFGIKVDLPLFVFRIFRFTIVFFIRVIFLFFLFLEGSFILHNMFECLLDLKFFYHLKIIIGEYSVHGKTLSVLKAQVFCEQVNPVNVKVQLCTSKNKVLFSVLPVIFRKTTTELLRQQLRTHITEVVY